MKHMALVRLISSFLLVATIQSCNYQSVSMNGSPCATVNATVQSKSNADLSLIFGTDAIQAALDFIKGSVAQLGSASTAEIVSGGTDAAVRTAKASGREVKQEDRAKLETYLRDEAVPAIRQNPTCNINSASPPKPYLGVEYVVMSPDQRPEIRIKNTGQAEATFKMVFAQFVNGSEHSKDSGLHILGPGLTVNVWARKKSLPISEIMTGKSSLIIALGINYPSEPNGKQVEWSQSWQYDPSSDRFIVISIKNR